MRIFFPLILFMVTAVAAAQGDGETYKVRVKGFADSYHAVRVREPNDWMSSRTRLRGEISLARNNTEMFFSANAVYNSTISDRSGLKLRELFVSQAFNNMEIRAGRQIITWGVADALRITDLVSPMDYSEFLAQDYDDIRIPETALRAKYSKNSFSLDAIAVPIVETFDLPFNRENPWAVSITGNDSIISGVKPEIKVRNAEFGGRLSWFFSGVDFSVCALRTFNKMPVFAFEYNADIQKFICTPTHKRMTMSGFDISIPVGKCVLRGEFAEYFHEAQQPKPGSDIEYKNSANALIGADIYPGGDWNLSFQYAHKFIGDFDGANATAYRNSGTATVRIAKDLFRSTLNVSTFAYIDTTNGGIYDRTAFDYAVNDMLHIVLGFDYFNADKGTFAMYDNNSEVFVKAKIGF